MFAELQRLSGITSDVKYLKHKTPSSELVTSCRVCLVGMLSHQFELLAIMCYFPWQHVHVYCQTFCWLSQQSGAAFCMQQGSKHASFTSII